MKNSLDFEFEYALEHADQLGPLKKAIEAAAHAIMDQSSDVKITKVTYRVAGFYPDLYFGG